MASTKQHQSIRKKLLEILGPGLPGIEIDVSDSPRWKRMCLTFRHPSFAGLLPEQRFRQLLAAIGEEFYEKSLRGAVWIELAPGETVDDILAAPRSEDLAKQEPTIARGLLDNGFFEDLKDAMGESPIETCRGDFAVSRKVLTAREIIGDEQRDACLVFIRQGAFCDCEVLLAARAALAQRYGAD
ncbi:MAG TPA: hypothetical protein VM243_18410 [Phycisphaerae bacterium]|nr:hypothetical protein [Phycisphaerae bacterium]